jgi:hypothetical protein
VEALGPKRGNLSYAKKKRKKWRQLQTGMDGLVWDYDLPKARSRTMRKTHLLFITLTYSRDYSIQEAWRLISSKGQALNRFSSSLTKVVGNKATYKAKEAQSSGYPAPHILCIMDRPVTAVKHGAKWIVQQRELVEQIKKAWPYGYVDVQACVGGRVNGRPPMSYLTKYATKTTEVSHGSAEPTISELTHAWQKAFGLRDVVSKDFLQRLNLLHVEPVSEDTGPRWELKQIEYRPDLVLLAQRKGWAVRPPDT